MTMSGVCGKVNVDPTGRRHGQKKKGREGKQQHGTVGVSRAFGTGVVPHFAAGGYCTTAVQKVEGRG